ncbi:MAG: quinone-dependent dihydroorotate dehydrogenase [Verrucomicrobiales bacterium]|nr:quinone-dependent dihydroorotate dehydrogenase [Verrucomicrobiales bacterium]
MSLPERLYPVLKPWLFRMDAERAHEWTTRALRWSHALGLVSRVAPPDGASVQVMGLSFPNRLGLAAGMDKSASTYAAWAALGLGAVEVGTLTPRPQSGNPRPRLFRLPEHDALINRMGFNNPGIAAAVARLKHRRTSAIVGVNIGKNFDTPNEDAVEDYRTAFRAAYPVADYIAINISSPNTKGLRDLQGEEAMRKLLGTLRREQERLTEEHRVRRPLVVKLAPDLDGGQVEGIARVLNEMAVDGVIATNTTISREGITGHPLAHETGGLSGAPVRERSDLMLQALRMLLREATPIIGVGGILSGTDAQAKRRLGAELLQVYTGLVFRGPPLIRDVLQTDLEV